ncbi:Uncharacterized protein conserved in bacteria [Aedoeadaptatus ivorii]|uniref:Uncharacterized protein conserved in bacteria n=1 Tax=Aedoeadaptatus ivorii TaxID=54006 RepID=A0A3S4Z3Q1_9FIRM|nr:CdaR family protein [Peptoniphilus ivorii]VEJ35573.1 Uncharacterized protein conserved in bacteria [Peptoniphilus ivorii]
MREKYLNFITKYRDTLTKVLSVVIAILLWYYVITEVDPKITKDFSGVEVELRNQSIMRDAGLELLKDEKFTVDVQVIGNRSAIVDLQEGDISAYVDLGEVAPGSQRLPIHLRIADDTVSVEKSSPKAISIAADEIISKVMPVEITSTGKPKDGYVLENITAGQEEVKVKGPKTYLDKVRFIRGYVPLNGATESVLASVDLVALDQNRNPIRGLEFEPKSISSQAIITKAVTVPIEVQYTNADAAGFSEERAILTPQNVTISGDGNVIDNVGSVLTEPVDVKELMNVYTMPVNLRLPEGVRLVNPDETTLLRYMKKESATKSLDISTKDIAGEKDSGISPADFRIPETIKVEIYGEKNLLEAIRDEDILLTVGENGRIRAEVPKDVEVIKLTPKHVPAAT